MLMAAMAALFMGLGFMIGGRAGMLIALGLAAVMNILAYWNSDKMVLKMHRAQEVGPEHPLHAIVAPLAERAGLPMPKVYIVEQEQPNAFATGRNPENAAVAATTNRTRGRLSPRNVTMAGPRRTTTASNPSASAARTGRASARTLPGGVRRLQVEPTTLTCRSRP